MSKNPQGNQPLQKGKGLKEFHQGHWQKEAGEVELSDGKYTEGEMENPMHLKRSVDDQSKYMKKHKMGYP